MSSCHCGGDADACSDAGEHTGPYRKSSTASDRRNSREAAHFFSSLREDDDVDTDEDEDEDD